MKNANTAQEFINVQSMGTYQEDFLGGEIWECNGEEWYLNIKNFNSLKELNEYLEITKGV